MRSNKNCDLQLANIDRQTDLSIDNSIDSIFARLYMLDLYIGSMYR